MPGWLSAVCVAGFGPAIGRAFNMAVRLANRRGLVTLVLSALAFPLAIAVRSADKPGGYAAKEWRAPGGDWAATRYSTLDRITTKNITQLGGAWVVDLPERAEASPLVVDGRMFVVTANGQILAFDPSTGAPLWTFKPEVPFG